MTRLTKNNKGASFDMEIAAIIYVGIIFSIVLISIIILALTVGNRSTKPNIDTSMLWKMNIITL